MDSQAFDKPFPDCESYVVCEYFKFKYPSQQVCFISIALHTIVQLYSGQTCVAQADLFFAIDGSDSVIEDDFKETKDFVVDVSDVMFGS